PNPRAPDGFEQCPPSKYEGLDDFLFLGDGQGGFRDASASAGIKGLAGKGLGIAICDFDQDMQPEIYVANDGEANFLLARKPSDDGAIAFEDQGMLAGVALSRSGYAQASMGVAAGDHDGNGTIDLFLTNFYGDSNTLYSNLGPMHFEDVTRRTGLSGPSRGVLGWGTAFVDFNHDGRLDLFVANGHVEDRRWNGQGEPYKMPPQVFRNEGGGRFSDVSQYAGEYFRSDWLGRGVAWGDFDRDGRVDLSVSHQLDRSSVLLNRTPGVEPLVILQLVGVQSNRSVIGARVETLDDAGRTLSVRQVTGGTSFQSAPTKELYLDSARGRAKAIRITWPEGKTQIEPWIDTCCRTLVESMAETAP
ncbi:MAG: FG-GAP repeat domain-containing protein, partial [Aureliella sp.]